MDILLTITAVPDIFKDSNFEIDNQMVLLLCVSNFLKRPNVLFWKMSVFYSVYTSCISFCGAVLWQ